MRDRKQGKKGNTLKGSKFITLERTGKEDSQNQD
jgi:hypothetical protein